MKRGLLSVALVLVLAGCAGGENVVSPTPTPTPSPSTGPMGDVPEGSVRFLVIGDAGMGNEDQEAVAQGMRKVCLERGCQFAIVNGDNIYSNGVRSAYDPQFEDKFEEPYRELTIPFFLVLGNHDNGNGNGDNPAVGDYQVEYARRVDRVSEKWNMPSRSYTFKFGDVQFFALDSGPSEVSQNAIWLDGTRGPVLRAWLAAEVAKSTAKWKFAFAHHPYISNGPHGDAGLYDNAAGRGLAYRLMLEDLVCDAMQVYFSGHDHDLQWLQPVNACGRTQFIVSGAAGASIYAKGAAPDNAVFYENHNAADHGFVWVDVTGSTFTGVFYKSDGSKLFERTFTTT